ncbi:MAG: methyltransferase domain-containing protein [Burkholderiaceae bacterium]
MNDHTRADGWQRGDAYERYMGRWSRQLAPRFLRWLDAPAGLRWLDVGCGTGALSAAIVESCAPACVIGADPSAGFLASAGERLGPRVALHRAPADALPLSAAAVDVAAASLVLNFVPDAPAALREMVRVTAAGGCVAACVWDYARKMDLIRRYWDAAARLQLVAPGQHQGERFALCHPDALAAAFTAAGLMQVSVSAIELPLVFADFDDYWLPFLGGQGPAPAHAVGLSAAARDRLRDAIRAELPLQGDGRIVLGARALAARGTVAGR